MIMINRKALTVFLILSFVIAWMFFLLPLAFGEPGSTGHQGAAAIFFALAMWAPGIAAIVTTMLVKKEKFSNLNLKRLGPKRYYLWAWLLFPVLAILAGVLTVVFGLGQLDLEFTAIQQAMAQMPDTGISPALLTLIQIAAALTFAPLFNTLFALGEELGWRGFLLPELLPLGQWKAVLIGGVIWGLWHAPAIWQGHNYPTVAPWIGVLMMTVFTLLTGIALSWLYLETRSPWAPALGHGALNAVAGLPLLFLLDVDIAFGGTLASVAGMIAFALFVVWLVVTKRFPVQLPSPAFTNKTEGTEL
jgi:membrane protease YdiL (CAAX protease family)